MKVTLDDLKEFYLLENLPSEFKNLKKGEYFVFYYTPDYQNSKLIIHKYEVVLRLNESLYRGIKDIAIKTGNLDIYVGYLPYQPFETRDGIFYLFLRTYCPAQNIVDFYDFAYEQDRAINFQISTGSSIDITDRSTFINALSYFTNPNKLNVISNIYDTVDGYLMLHENKSLYSDYIKKVVQIVFHDSGVMPEENGDIRFMVIGEKANLNDSEKEKLNSAKSLLRSLVSPKDVYIQTGWFYDVNDGRWKSNISDYDSFLRQDFIVDFPENRFKAYKPNFSTVSDSELFSLFNNPEFIFNKGYNGKLSDVLNHEKLYQYYPHLRNLPLLYRELYNKGDYTFYYSGSGDGSGYMNISGNNKQFDILSVMLHETQHAIQDYENFAQGGNEFIAKFVVSIGSSQVRKIFSGIDVFQKFIKFSLISESDYSILKSAIENTKIYSDDARSIKSRIINFLSTYDDFNKNKHQLGFYIIFLIAFNKVYNEGDLIEFLESRYGFEIYDLIESIKDANDSVNEIAGKLTSEGFRKEDINRIMFNAYEDLLGEVESRSTQNQMRIPVNLSNYFFINEWEKNPTRKIAVIGGNYIKSDISKIKAAVEKSDDKYILHFKKDKDLEPFVHELGHIVHDILVKRGYESEIIKEYNKAITSDDYDEYFVNCFLGYLIENIDDELLVNELSLNNKIKSNNFINVILDEIFNPERKVINQKASEYLSYLNSFENL